MPTYIILQNPGHNRVYFKAARALALVELELAGKKMSTAPTHLREEIIGGIPYLLFDAEPLADADILLLSRLSFVYGIFEKKNDSLMPLEKNPKYFFEDDDIITILKYNGKTNEIFTRLMVNVAAFFNASKHSLNILDPLCGKGTSLFDGLLCGHNVSGIELDEKIVHEAYIFLKKYLENARCKHSSHQQRQGMEKYTAKRYQLNLPQTKIEFIAGDTRDTGLFYRKNSFDVIVGDLPYGVQHASKKNKDKSRNALPLLEEALPAWHKVLKPGGTITLAWNLLLIERVEMESVLEKNGFKLAMLQGDDTFIHRVDQAIMRDLIVGIKS